MSDLEEYLSNLPLDQQEMFAEAQLGVEADAFCRSDLGRYLLGRAKQEEHDALAALGEVDPHKPEAVIDLQNALWRARSFRQWILEAIQGGTEAEKQLRITESEY